MGTSRSPKAQPHMAPGPRAPGPRAVPEMQTNRRWIRSWLLWNLDRIFSLAAAGTTSNVVLSKGQDPAGEPLHGEADTGSAG